MSKSLINLPLIRCSLFLLTFSISTQTVYSYQSSNQKKKAVNQALDSWESAINRHNEMADELSWEKTLERADEKEFKKQEMKTFEFIDQNRRNDQKDKVFNKHEVSIEGQRFFAKYNEPDVMRQRGTLNGYAGKYTYRPTQKDLLNTKFFNTYRVDGMYADGDFDYEAQTVSSTGLTSGKDNYMYEIRGVMGKEYVTKSGNYLYTYGGYGYRYLNDDDKDGLPTQVGNTVFLGYERESNYLYVPIGIEAYRPMKNSWSVLLNVEYDRLVSGKQISHLTDADPFTSGDNSDFTNDQNGGYGFRGSIQVAKEISKVEFYVEPFFRYWNINQSRTTTGRFNGSSIDLVEPRNTTIEMGGKIGLKF